jgi:hypothetical protein
MPTALLSEPIEPKKQTSAISLMESTRDTDIASIHSSKQFVKKILKGRLFFGFERQ